MATKKNKNTWVYTLVITATIFITGVIVAFYMIKEAQDNAAKKGASLEVINPNQVNKELVDESVRDVRAGHVIDRFSLINQFGDTITNDAVKGKVYVADFFFTTCPGICISMSKNLMKVQEKMADTDFMILSHTVWPEVDSVEAMKAYADKHQARRGTWHFLTGSKAHIYELARKSYFTLKPAAVGKKGDGDSDFIHTSNFVLVDGSGQIRGYYNGTDTVEVNQMLRDARELLQQR